MSLSEALDSLERAWSQVSLKDLWGEPLVGMEAFGVISQFHRSAWEALEKQLESSQIPPEEYYQGGLILTQAFERMRFQKRIEKKLANLQADQVELDLLPRRAS